MPKGFAFLRRVLVIERWDPALVERAIGELCSRNRGPGLARDRREASRRGALTLLERPGGGQASAREVCHAGDRAVRVGSRQ